MFLGLTDREVALSSPIYVFFFFDNSGHVLKNSSMNINSGVFIYCFILHRDLWVRYAPIVVCFFPQRGQPSCSKSSGIISVAATSPGGPVNMNQHQSWLMRNEK